jgi:hypothetical protein
MGAWSHESFGNDDACDWASQLKGPKDLALVEATLDKVLASEGEYLEALEASEAIAAAEAVARLQGHFGTRDSYSKSLDGWVERIGLKPERALAEKARRALDRIVSERSELLELWQDSEEGSEWLVSVAELKTRIDA